MLKSKLKKLACITLAVSMVFSNVNTSVKAKKEVDGSSYSKYDKMGFANAVKAFYETEKTKIEGYEFYENYQVNGDFEIACFTDNYEYSIVKQNDPRQKYPQKDSLGKRTEISANQAQASCIWEEELEYGEHEDGNYSDTLCPGETLSISYFGEGEGIARNILENNKGKEKTMKWSYDIVQIRMASGTSNIEYYYYAVNVKPANDAQIIQGEITLPAYIWIDPESFDIPADKNGNKINYVKCIELGDAAFLCQNNIEAVNIPDTYQRICAYAFTGCVNLSEINFVKTEKTNEKSPLEYIDCYRIDASDSSSDKALENSNLHFIGSGAFAGCIDKELTSVKLPTVLTEGYRIFDKTGQDQGYAAVDIQTDGKTQKKVYGTNGLVLNQDAIGTANKQFNTLIKKANTKYEYCLPYFMGQGVFRDCYGLTQVTISGVNPYIPANTYAGCSGIDTICIEDSVQNIYFGPACFAGADGDADLASKLTSLKLDNKNLKNVIIGAYSFKNCNKLEDVTITAELNSQNIYSKVQSTELYGEYAFENAFAEESSFEYAPKTSSEFIIPEGFFKNSDVKDINFGGKLSYNQNASDKNSPKITVGAYSFTATDCNSINLCTNTVELCTSSLYGLSADDCTIKSDKLIFKGEPFSNTVHTLTTDPMESKLKKFTIDSSEVELKREIMGEYVPLWNEKEMKFDSEYCSCELYPSFYGAPFMKVVFTDKLKKLDNPVNGGGSFATKDYAYYYYNVKKRNKDFDPKKIQKSKVVTHTPFSSIEGVYFQGYTIKKVGNIFYSDKETVAQKIYADGKTKEALNEALKESSTKTNDVKPYTTGFVDFKDIDLIKGKKGISLDYGLKNYKITVNYADGLQSDIEYSEQEQMEYNNTEDKTNYSGVNGFIMSNYSPDSANPNMEIRYRDITKPTLIHFIAKVPTIITASAVKGTDFVAGTEPNLSDFEITNVQYNDDTTVNETISFNNGDENVEDNHDLLKSGFSVSVVSTNGSIGSTYTLGTNTVVITYKYIDDNKLEKTCTSTCTVTAEAPKVTTLTAELNDTTKTYYEGDVLTAEDFKITAEYNDGNKDSEYAKLTDKYTIIPEILPEISESSKPVTIVLTDENGASTSVDINVNKIEPALLTVSYPTDVELGTELNKEDFEVTLHYNNRDTEVLGSDEFELHYSNLHVGPNSITVTYNKRPLTVFGLVTINVVEAPATEAPVVEVTEVPATEAPVEVTEAPAATTETPATEVPNTITDTETTAAPTATTSVTLAPATEAPTATASTTPATVAPTASTTPATAVPTATASTTPAPTATTIVQGPNPSSMTGQLDGSVTKATIGVGEKIAILNLASVTYTSSDSNILAVNNNIVTGKKVGKATVTIADANGNSKIYSITVKKAPKKIKASSKKVLKKGKTAKIKVLFQKGCYSYTNTFKSSNKKVATVDKTGVVTAKAKGSCKITVKTYNNKKATVKITVK